MPTQASTRTPAPMTMAFHSPLPGCRRGDERGTRGGVAPAGRAKGDLPADERGVPGLTREPTGMPAGIGPLPVGGAGVRAVMAAGDALGRGWRTGVWAGDWRAWA